LALRFCDALGLGNPVGAAVHAENERCHLSRIADTRPFER
jgi:hypothetical protein